MKQQMIWHEAKLEVTTEVATSRKTLQDHVGLVNSSAHFQDKMRERHMAQPGGTHILTLSDLEVNEKDQCSWL